MVDSWSNNSVLFYHFAKKKKRRTNFKKKQGDEIQRIWETNVKRGDERQKKETDLKKKRGTNVIFFDVGAAINSKEVDVARSFAVS